MIFWLNKADGGGGVFVPFILRDFFYKIKVDY